ncbi:MULTISPECIES: ABC transporter permease [Streptosporangium]|uniref:Peptide/nickel transport system permease protein n=1 Tax=Streptosporangium brasiliense TaxID=47480 RepID=A0ABT9R4E2_9ACTN|nr:ABC transporter permease [Streptosporangium brasiliense]MDP9863330.1 peptide/nickel transport system permease protein [Streptosporangium brasiliense]
MTRLPVSVAAAFAVLLAVAVAAVSAPWLVPDATGQDLMLGIAGPGPGHPLGTDDLGRDVLQLLVAGARTAVPGALCVAVGSMLIGNLVGLPAGYLGGWVDALAMRWADLMFSLPALLVAIVVAGVLGGGYGLAIAVLVVLFAPTDTRVVRGAVLEQRHRPYVEAARLKNLSAWRIMTRHVWPNIAPVALANAFLNFAYALVSLASLSFLGLGVPAGSPDWGRTLSDNRTQLLANPWAVIAPGLAIIATAAALNIVGDWLYERVDRRGRAR